MITTDALAVCLGRPRQAIIGGTRCAELGGGLSTWIFSDIFGFWAHFSMICHTGKSWDLFWLRCPCCPPRATATSTANLRTKIMDLRRFDSSIISIWAWNSHVRSCPWGISRSLSQAILVGTILVGRLGVFDTGLMCTWINGYLVLRGNVLLRAEGFEHVLTCVYIYIYTYTYTYIHKYMYIYMYMHKYIIISCFGRPGGPWRWRRRCAPARRWGRHTWSPRPRAAGK